MLAIFKRCAPWYFAHLLTYGFLCFRSTIFNPEAIIFASVGLPIWMSSAIYWSEQGESEPLLRLLPIGERRIVRMKSSLALGFIAICICMQFFAAVANGFLDGNYALTLTLLGLSGCGALLTAAIAFAGIWFFGAKALSWVFLIFHIGGSISFLSFWGRFRGDFIHEIERVPVFGVLAGMPWFLAVGLFVCAIFGFYGLTGVAARIRRMDDLT